MSEQIAVFGVTDPPKDLSTDAMRTWKAKEKIKNGYHPFGPKLSGNGKTCKDCKSRISGGGRTGYYKCAKAKVSMSVATDLRLWWPSCELFEERE